MTSGAQEQSYLLEGRKRKRESPNRQPEIVERQFDTAAEPDDGTKEMYYYHQHSAQALNAVHRHHQPKEWELHLKQQWPAALSLFHATGGYLPINKVDDMTQQQVPLRSGAIRTTTTHEPNSTSANTQLFSPSALEGCVARNVQCPVAQGVLFPPQNNITLPPADETHVSQESYSNWGYTNHAPAPHGRFLLQNMQRMSQDLLQLPLRKLSALGPIETPAAQELNSNGANTSQVNAPHTPGEYIPLTTHGMIDPLRMQQQLLPHKETPSSSCAANPYAICAGSESVPVASQDSMFETARENGNGLQYDARFITNQDTIRSNSMPGAIMCRYPNNNASVHHSNKTDSRFSIPSVGGREVVKQVTPGNGTQGTTEQGLNVSKINANQSDTTSLLKLLLVELRRQAPRITFANKVQCFLGPKQGKVLEPASRASNEKAFGTTGYQKSQKENLHSLID